MLSYKESLKILKEANALIEGHFILSSGLHSPQYVQCAQLMSKPDKAKKICESLSEKINSEFKEFDIILSPAMGGIVLGYEIGRLLNKETIFSERVNGEFKLRRDFLKSSLECSKLVLDNEANIVGYACLINRSNGKSSLKGKIVSQVDLNIPTYTEENLPSSLSALKAVKPGSRNL